MTEGYKRVTLIHYTNNYSNEEQIQSSRNGLIVHFLKVVFMIAIKQAAPDLILELYTRIIFNHQKGFHDEEDSRT